MQVVLSTGPSTHLDHLAPLCYYLGIPLVITDCEHLAILQKFYPMIECQYVSMQDLTLEYMAHQYDTIITCGKFWAMELKPLLQMFFNKSVRFIFAPHGYSDKEDFLQDSVDQDIRLVYKKEGPGEIEMGNIRFAFYQEFKTHFDALAKPYFPHRGKKTVLYAPTYITKATTTSFFEKMDEVLKVCENKYHLIVKLHPLLEENSPAQYHKIIETYKNEVVFIQDFPPIYPLLEKTDIYLGDFSSIGYDFLSYNRPLFFLKEGGKLQECGQLLKGSLDDPQHHLEEKRKRLYQGAFSSSCTIEKFKKNYSSVSAQVSS